MGVGVKEKISKVGVISFFFLSLQNKLMNRLILEEKDTNEY